MIKKDKMSPYVPQRPMFKYEDSCTGTILSFDLTTLSPISVIRAIRVQLPKAKDDKCLLKKGFLIARSSWHMGCSRSLPLRVYPDIQVNLNHGYNSRRRGTTRALFMGLKQL
jgi:hypothetical protein